MITAVEAAENPTYDGKDKRDPFVPLVTLTTRDTAGGLSGIEGADDLKIEGIVYDPNGSVIIVNGQVLKEGDEKGGVKVLKIDPAGAKFLISGTESYVRLYRDETKQK